MGLESISGSMRKLFSLGANRSGFEFPHPTETADESHRTSLVCREFLVESLITVEAFST